MKEEILATWRGLMEQGTKNLGKDCFVEAEYYFCQCVPLARELSIPEILAFTLRLLATVKVRLGELESAEKGFKEAAAICIEIQNAKGMSEAWAGLANVAVIRGSIEEAANWYERSIAVYPLSSPRLRLGMLYSDLGQVYASNNNLEKAEKAFIKAKELCHSYDYPRGEGELNVLLGEICFRQGNRSLAQQYLRKACQLFAIISDNQELASALQYLAFLYYDFGDLWIALECQQRSTVLWLKIGKKEEGSDGLFFLSKIAQGLYEYSAAKDYLVTSIETYPKRDLGLALRYQGLAWLFIQELDWVQADENFREALGLFEEIKDDTRAEEVYEVLAYLAIAHKMDLENRDIRRKDLVKITNGNSLALEATQKLGKFHENRHNYFEALRCYWQALYIAKRDDEEVQNIEKAIQRISRKVRKKNRRSNQKNIGKRL
ncbi:MAG: tetratricopeptide repeat protein [Desulfitobacteriaceae bacterium]